MARGLVLCFVVLLAVFERGASLRCYSCTSTRQRESCGENSFTATDAITDCAIVQDSTSFHRTFLSTVFPDIDSLVSVSNNNAYCLKFTDLSGTVTARSCVYAPTENDVKQLCDRSKTLLKNCQYCGKDLCNGSSTIASSVPVAILALVATYLFYKH